MAQVKLNTIQIVLMAQYENLLIQIMAHISENEMTQLKDMFQIVATWLQYSTEEYTSAPICQNTFSLHLVKQRYEPF